MTHQTKSPHRGMAAAGRPVVGFAALAAAAGLLFLAAVPVSALESCAVGQKVVIPGGRIGTVIAVNGAACTVRQDDGVMGDAVWSAFMLKAAEGGEPAPAATAIEPGRYRCHTTAGYSFTDVVILDGTTYADRDGRRGRYALAADGTIDYSSGTFAGHPSFAKNGNIHLTAPGGDFYMTCNR